MRPNTSDAWLLLAICYGNGSAAHAVKVADGLNHAIPTPEEWEHAGVVLGERDLIQPDDPFPTVTARGKALVERGHSGLGRFDALCRRIDDVEIIATAVSVPGETEMAQGYEVYSWKIQEILKSFRER